MYLPLEEPFEISSEDRNRIWRMLSRADDLACYAREVEEEVYGQPCEPSTAEKDKAECALTDMTEAYMVVVAMTRDLVYNKKLSKEAYMNERELYNLGKEEEEWPYWEQS